MENNKQEKKIEEDKKEEKNTNIKFDDKEAQTIDKKLVLPENENEKPKLPISKKQMKRMKKQEE